MCRAALSGPAGLPKLGRAANLLAQPSPLRAAGQRGWPMDQYIFKLLFFFFKISSFLTIKFCSYDYELYLTFYSPEKL